MNSNGVWTQQEADLYHASSPKLAKFLCKYLDKKVPVYDFGCGPGYYLAELSKKGFDCTGIEGSSLSNFLHDTIIQHDLTKPMLLQNRGTVLSFETGEHLPEAAEDTFITTLVINCESKMILSWATPGQPGVGHWNCRPHTYIIARITERGFIWNKQETQEIRQNVDKRCDWLERNLLVFDRVA